MGNWLLPDGFGMPSDAAKFVGCGGLLGKSWFALRWPKIENLPDITILELVPIVLAASVRGQLWSRQRILFNCDNLAVVHVLQNKTSRDSRLL